MKKIILSAGFLLTILFVKAQTPSFQWAKSIGGGSTDIGYSIVTDGVG